MKNKGWLIIVGLLFSGCSMTGFQNPRSIPSISTPTVSISQTLMSSKTIDLSEQFKSGMMGKATFSDEGGGKTRVVVTVAGKGIAGPLPNHIHTGSCPNPGAVLYPLNDIKNGKSDTVIGVGMSTLFGSCGTERHNHLLRW